MFSRGIKLTVETDSDVYFLPPRPNSEIDQGDTGSASMISNTLLTGTVRISAARATDVHTVRVELVSLMPSAKLTELSSDRTACQTLRDNRRLSTYQHCARWAARCGRQLQWLSRQFRVRAGP